MGRKSTGMDETMTANNLESFTVKQLKDELTQRSLPTNGIKNQLITRLKQAMEGTRIFMQLKTESTVIIQRDLLKRIHRIQIKAKQRILLPKIKHLPPAPK
jgi:hypothetical protein